MAGMGQTGTLNVTPEMMDAAIQAIESYKETISQLNSNVENEVTTLTSNDFTGSAATGFTNFYQNNVVPATTTNLDKLLDNFTEICKSVKAAIPDTDGVDEQLGTANNTAGQSEA